MELKTHTAAGGGRVHLLSVSSPCLAPVDPRPRILVVHPHPSPKPELLHPLHLVVAAPIFGAIIPILCPMFGKLKARKMALNSQSRDLSIGLAQEWT
ncbi:hypothetical protein SORBI_3007G218200 [Sorghum bicolor]|uniref:Uncharacterized protein n=1 Tax=Sorghum bicolor TaxID=4558 RepID=A0A1B6PJ14_SORBI|nr:hypothetical protein SORBI_3007G218200 [Sorghum bicolor]KXG25687.1 hypothetical protein SORBI_3007G218200 [Sorghum bicolor]